MQGSDAEGEKRKSKDLPTAAIRLTNKIDNLAPQGANSSPSDEQLAQQSRKEDSDKFYWLFARLQLDIQSIYIE